MKNNSKLLALVVFALFLSACGRIQPPLAATPQLVQAATTQTAVPNFRIIRKLAGDSIQAKWLGDNQFKFVELRFYLAALTSERQVQEYFISETIDQWV